MFTTVSSKNTNIYNTWIIVKKNTMVHVSFLSLSKLLEGHMKDANLALCSSFFLSLYRNSFDEKMEVLCSVI